MRLAVRHETHYRFDTPLAQGLQRLRLSPKENHGQSVRAWRMELTGARVEVVYDDHNANHVTLASILPGTTELVIACEGVVDTADRAGVVGRHNGRLPLWAFQCQSPLTRPGARLKALAAPLAAVGDDRLAQLHSLSQAVLGAVTYAPGHTDVGTSAEEALAAGRGVCQDHAHIFIGAARLLGFPARYVSGYLLIEGRTEQDAGHGWAEAHVDGLGWVGFDVSNGISPDARYVRVASGRDYAEAAPVTGITWGQTASSLSVSLAVEQQAVQQ
ncbi:transglutaminase domain-containing protein [Novosphingobium piscinae]|uniref:Transglutaminase family protein n=1 Tax=Novosphingobium piscinae TaxID=1507448 RepID=A0A7X1FYR0_9SPHN|nr:transglutaminase family protein [Novosphingobium piscinae]MBC2669339.1 transglutaminase family protein [Novosphingobium piscinae]